MDDYRGRNKNVFFILAVLFVPALSIESRSVNLALETSFLFDPQDITENATFINKVQTVLDKLKTVLEPENPVFRGRDNDDKVILTRFLSQIGSALIKFDNNDIKKITNDLRDAVYKYAVKHKEFNELFEDERLRAFIKNTVNVWAETDPMVLKVEIAKYITSVDTDSVIELFRILNKVFDTTDEPKFKKLTKKFTKSIKNKDFTKFLSKTIDFVVFKRYKKLNFLLKHIIKEELKKFTEYVSKEYADRVVANPHDRRFSLSHIAHSEGLFEGKDSTGINYDKMSDGKIPEDKDSSGSNEKTRMNEKITQRDGMLIDDIVINKDLDLNVHNDKSLK